jgi:hypothetical protein
MAALLGYALAANHSSLANASDPLVHQLVTRTAEGLDSPGLICPGGSRRGPLQPDMGDRVPRRVKRRPGPADDGQPDVLTAPTQFQAEVSYMVEKGYTSISLTRFFDHLD